MRKTLFYIVGVMWMLTGIVAIGCVGGADAAETIREAVVCYLKAVAWGGLSFLLLGATTHLAWEVD